MKYTILINSELSFDLYIEDGKFYIDDHNYGFKNMIELIYRADRIEVHFNGREIAYIDLSKSKVVYLGNLVTTNEIRMTTQAMEYDEGSPQREALISDIARLRESKIKKSDLVRTELHTHFMEMLTGEQFLKVLFDFVDKLPVDVNGHLIGHTVDESGQKVDFQECIADFIKKDDVVRWKSVAGELSIPVKGQGTFIDLSVSNAKRNNLIDYVARELKKVDKDNMTISDIKKVIYYFMLYESLDLLKSMGIKYVELSYSNDSTIKKILEYGAIKGFPKGIEFRFLLSANRQRFNNYTYVKETKKNLRSMMEKGMIAGFDLMGEELPLSENDKNFNDPCSFANFTLFALDILNKYSNSVYRLHMGENRHSYVNPVTSLEIIAKAVKVLGIKVPPPQIRIGHGVFFEKINASKYEELLKRFQVIVEINASSNYGLGNVEDMKEIPYNWYKDRSIPVVIATDGGGTHLTDPLQEATIAIGNGGDTIGYIKESEKKIGR